MWSESIAQGETVLKYSTSYSRFLKNKYYSLIVQESFKASCDGVVRTIAEDEFSYTFTEVADGSLQKEKVPVRPLWR